MQIKIIKPDKQFKDYIQKITLFRTKGRFIYRQKLTASPFTCLSYNHYDIPSFRVNGTQFVPECSIQVTGPKINDDIYAFHNGRLSQILIELRPSSFYYLFHQSPLNIVNKTVSISNFLSREKTNKHLQQLKNENLYKSHVRLLYGIIEELIPGAIKQVDFIEDAINLIDKSSGNISVQSICGKINKSERQFNRKFTEIVGIPPIQYIKIRQLHFIINLIHLKQYKFIKEIAYDTGFYDPAHFTKSFKRLTGMSPEVFIKSDEHIALDYFSELI